MIETKQIKLVKTKQIKIATCLLTGAILFSTGAGNAAAASVQQSGLSQTAGFSLVLIEPEEETADAFQKGVEEAARAQERLEQAQTERYAKTAVAQVNDYVNVREAATEESEIVGRMENHAVAEIEGFENGWYRIRSGSISGYVQSDYLIVGDCDLIDSVRIRLAEVQTQSLKVRREASEESSVLMLAAAGDRMEVLDGGTEEWVKVSTSQGEGYVSSGFVKVEDSYLYAKKPEEVSGGTAAAQYGLQFVGNPYRWGGASLTNGTDCSGFIMSVYAHYGISLPHSSAAMRGVGFEVSYEEARPGDIICYSGHVALYIGDGLVVHAANEQKGITVSSATHKNILTVRRIFQ